MTVGYSRVADLGGYFNNIYEDAVFALREQTLATRLVRTFTDGKGDQTRSLTEYPTVTPVTVEEMEDFAKPTQFDKTLLATLTPAEKMSQVIITDRRMETDPQNTRQDASVEMGAGMAQLVDTDILGNISSMTGGTLGASGSTMLWGYFYATLARMRKAKIPEPWVCVMHPYHWHDLMGVVLPGATVTNAPEFQDEVLKRYFVRRVSNVDIFVTGNAPESGTDAYTGVFNPQAMAFDLRRDARLEPERDASARAWELNFSMLYAHGVWRPKLGFYIIADATAPTS